MSARGLLAGLIAILAAAVSIASAVVRSESEKPAHYSPMVWPNHPLTLRSLAMAEIGQAAARGELPSAQTMRRVRLLAARAPLEPEQFLIEAALAQKRGEAARTGRLLLEARQRDPRSPGARYLLSDHLIRNGDIVGGLREMTMLSRMVPGSADQLMPGLVEYARTPGAVPRLRRLFSENPDLRPVLLSTLASDAANADLVLALAPPSTDPGDPARWRGRLLKSLVDAGMYAKAYEIWRRFAGGGAPGAGLFRPDFAPTPEPPPFNWTFAQSGGGLAEPARGGGLRVLHFGRSQTVLATQLMLLPAGRYELSFAVGGDIGSEGQLRWRIVCLPARQAVLDLPLGKAGEARTAGQFQVPPTGCEAQRIDLIGAPTDSPKSSDATITQLRLSRVAE